MDGTYLLGIDIGTSGTKTALFTAEGKLLASATVGYPLAQPRPGWAEQHPEDWWQAAARGVRLVLAEAGAQAGVRPEEVVAIGLSGQMHGAVLLDKADAVIRPALIWCDQRSSPQAARLGEQVGQARIIELTANPALPNFQATKLLWVKENEPENYGRIAHVLLPKDYVRFRLTGEWATEVSDASGTLLLDVARRRWSAEMLDLLEVPSAWLPAVYESPEVSGRLSAAAAAATGLRPGTPVAGGGGDQAAGAVGSGIVTEGLVSVTIGTSGVVFAFTPQLKADPLGRLHTFCHAVPGKWHVMGVTQAAGGSLQWFRNTFGAAEIEVARQTGADPYEYLTAAAARVAPGAEGVLFLPYLMGERTPHLDPQAKGVFYGVTARHTRAHLARAVLEGVTFSLKDCLRLIEDLGIDAQAVRLSGGGARSALWRQMQADIFGRPAEVVSSAEGPAFGAALLAGVGAGLYPSVEEACQATIRSGERVEPSVGGVAAYARAYARYRRLYPALKAIFAESDD